MLRAVAQPLALSELVREEREVSEPLAVSAPPMEPRIVDMDRPVLPPLRFNDKPASATQVISSTIAVHA